MDLFLKKECDLKFFHNNGYVRKKCTSCGEFFWTLESNAKLCGDQPCVDFSFIEKKLVKKPISLKKVRDSFLYFFEKNGHLKVHYPETGERCPVVARWRNDIYLTIASIADFQPHVTSGEVPPPANPLVISQPCIRLNDLEQVGISGRHLTMFEMMGHHAFNKKGDEIYFKEETVRLCDEFFVNNIGIPKEKIYYKEQLWDGGGNAGPCLEVLAGGLEIATLVFMNMKQDENGEYEIKNKRYTKNPLNIVDTGYGLERIAWVTNGTKTIYETALKDIIEHIKKISTVYSDLTNIYTLSDHTKCLAFMLGDGIIPSNVKAGYLARLIIRRSLRLLEKLNLNVSLKSLVNLQLDLLEEDFPSLKLGKKTIGEILDVETKKFSDTITKGKGLVSRLIRENKNLDKDELIRLYDTHGMPPDIVKKIALKRKIKVDIPENFDSMIAELHFYEKKEKTIQEINENLPTTKCLYYENHYTKEFDAEVLWTKKLDGYMKAVFDKTAFYPDGGGQPGDVGILTVNNKKITVDQVLKEGNSIVHSIDGELKIGDKVHGNIDWDHRYTLMKHHTGTHVINGALRKIFGEHIWQAGSQLGINEARFDFSHYKSLTEKEKEQVEILANELIQKNIRVEKKVMDRNSAEREYGFRLYQGGVPLGNMIRILNIPGIDVEACGGTHLDNIGEIEKIRILKVERIQDGVNRITFAAGKKVEEYLKEENKLYNKIKKSLSVVFDIKERGDVSEQLKEVSNIFSVRLNQLDKTINRFLKEAEIKQRIIVLDIKEAGRYLFREWKRTQKMKKIVPLNEIEQMMDQAKIIPGTKIKLITGITKSDSTIVAGAIVKKLDYVVHIYDGKKITSAASKNLDIDLTKEIAPKVGKILGGSGGGKPNLTQSGGPIHNKAREALDEAERITIKILAK